MTRKECCLLKKGDKLFAVGEQGVNGGTFFTDATTTINKKLLRVIEMRFFSVTFYEEKTTVNCSFDSIDNFTRSFDARHVFKAQKSAVKKALRSIRTANKKAIKTAEKNIKMAEKSLCILLESLK